MTKKYSPCFKISIFVSNNTQNYLRYAVINLNIYPYKEIGAHDILHIDLMYNG